MSASESDVQRKPARAAGTISFLNLFGTPIRLHFTFLLLFIFLVFIGIGEKQSGPQTAIYVTAIFGSVMLHEIAHAIMARRFGIRTLEIVMFPIGGLSRLERVPSASQEFWVALAGPVLNLAIGVGLLAWQGNFFPLDTLREPTDANLLERIAVGNLVIGAFNLLPAYPMDGGRILRSIVSLFRPEEVATQLAASTGKMLAVGMVLSGLLSSNFVLVFTALFVYLGAMQEGNAARGKLFTSGRAVRDAMITDFRSLAHGSSIRDAGDLLLATAQHDFPVTLGSQVLGLLSRSALMRAMMREGPEAYVSGAMERDYIRLSPQTDLSDALQRMAERRAPALVMDDEDQLVGMLTPEHLSEFILLKQMSSIQARSQAK